jgi:hypothetical protein
MRIVDAYGHIAGGPKKPTPVPGVPPYRGGKRTPKKPTPIPNVPVYGGRKKPRRPTPVPNIRGR